MKKYKREHIYSKNKKITIKNEKSENGSFSCVDEVELYLFGLDETLWGRFIIDVINNKQQLKIPKYENFKYILNEIDNEQTKRIIMNIVFDIDNYNPFVDIFPIEKIPQNYQKYILKKQDFIKKYYKFNEKFEYKNKKVSCRYNTQELSIKLALKKNDILMLFNSHSLFILSNKNIDLTKIFNYLNNAEPNKWIIENKNRIYLKKNCKTQFFLPQYYEKIINLL